MSVTILDRTHAEGECTVWDGPVTDRGYGSVWHAGKQRLVHRAVWEQSVGPIPADLTIDHLCRNKRCVNVAHLEVVTRSENSRRALAGRTHCKWGHALTGDNVRLQPRAGGATRRVCKTCTSHRFRRELALKNGYGYTR